METLSKRQEKEVIKWMAKEFLEERLGVEATPENIRRLAAHIIVFEIEIKQRAQRRQRKKVMKRYLC